MRRILVTLALMCMAICTYAQRDIPAGGSMEVASIESDDSVGGIGQGKQISMYKVKPFHSPLRARRLTANALSVR